MTVTEIDVVKDARTRITNLQEIIGQLFQLRYGRSLLAGIRVLPGYPVLQSFLYAEVGIVEAFVHASGLVERFHLVLQHVPGKTEPFGHDLIQGCRPLAGLWQLVLQRQSQHARIVHARGPPVMSHGIEGMDTRGFQYPVAQSRFQPETKQLFSQILPFLSGQGLVDGIIRQGGHQAFVGQPQIGPPYGLPRQHFLASPCLGTRQRLQNGLQTVGITLVACHQVSQR